MLEPNLEDIESVKKELGTDGYYGWLIIKKESKSRAMLKGELHLLKDNESELTHRIVLRFEPDENFKESYIIGAFFEGQGSFFSKLLDSVKDTNIGNAVTSAVNIMSNQPSQ